MAGSIRIVTWNANGLRQRIPELELFLEEQKIDIALISETHLTKQSNVRIKGFQIYDTIHPSNNARGGSAVIIRENIKHYEEQKYSTGPIQATTVKIRTNKWQYNVTAVYCPPRHNLKKDDYSAFLRSLGNRFVCGGDFNCKHLYWGSRISNAKGKELYSAGNELNCSFLSSGKPSYWPTDPGKLPDLIDFFITRGVSSNYTKVDTSLDLSSDHTPVILTLSDTVISKPSSPALTNRRTDWEGFRSELERTISLNVSLKSTEELDNEARSFRDQLQYAAKNNTPSIDHKLPGKNYPREVKILIQEKRKARKKWQTTRNPERKTIFNRLTQQLTRLLQRLKNEGISQYLQGLSAEKDTNYSLWKATKRIKKPVFNAMPIRKRDGSWARSSQEKADTLADHLESVFQPNPPMDSDQELILEDNNNQVPIKHVSPKEIAQEIKMLNSKKSPGIDLITVQMIKELPPKGIIKLTHLFNAAFRLKHVPAQWKIAEVIAILKPGKPPEEVSSHRPISLLPVIAKLFERIFLKRLKTIIDKKMLVPTHQFGFRDKHSTIDQVHRITSNIERALEEKKVCATVFLDVAQAFDKVWHKGLNYKLNKLLPKSYSNFLKSYLENRSFRVRCEDSHSTIRSISAGVPQGSVLGPTLYLLYTADIPKCKDTKIATFADDTCILATGINTRYATIKLQHSLNKVSEWTKKWRIKLNETKSQHVNFTNLRQNPLPLRINGQIVPYANSAKYLGMTLDARLRWKEHIKIKCKQLKTLRAKMEWLIGRNSHLSIRNKLLLYKQILKPVWLYGIQLWGCSKDSNVKDIQLFQNKVLRNIVNAQWYVRNKDIHRDLKMDSVSEVRVKVAKKHQQRLQNHCNPEAFNLLSTQCLPRRLKRTKPLDLVNLLV